VGFYTIQSSLVKLMASTSGLSYILWFSNFTRFSFSFFCDFSVSFWWYSKSIWSTCIWYSTYLQNKTDPPRFENVRNM